MSNTFSKSSTYINSLVDFTLDTKPYHSKLTEVAVEYRFEDTINVNIIDAVASRMVKKAGWMYNFYSGGDVNNRTFDLKRLVMPNIRRHELNSDQSNTHGAFKVGRDENVDMGTVPYVYDKHSTAGIADAWLERAGTRVEYLVQGNDFHHNYGSMEFRITAASPTDTDQSPRWQETRAETVLTTVNSVTQQLALARINDALPWSIANSHPNSANYRIRQILNAIQAQLTLTPNPSAQANLNAIFTILNTPSLPQTYEALWVTLEEGGTPIINNPMTGLPYTGWRGEDGYDSNGDPLPGATYVDDHISQNTPPAFFNALSDSRVREAGGTYYDDRVLPGFRIYNIQTVADTAVDEWTVTVSDTSPTVLEVTGSIHGFMGAVMVGNTFTSQFITFQTAVEVGVPSIGDSYTLTPDARLVIDPAAPLEVWNLIKTDPLAHSRPTFTSTRYGYIRSLSNVVGEATILSNTLPTGTVVLTALNSTTFSLSSTAEPSYTGTATVGTVFNDGHLGFTIVAGTAQAFAAGDKFYINIINEPARAEEFDLYYGYDLDSYDNQTRVYENQSMVNPLYGQPLDFRFDSRFTDYNLDLMSLQIAQNAVSGYKYRLTANADGAPIDIIQSDNSGPSAFIDLAEPGGGSIPVFSMPSDANPAPDLTAYYAGSFKLERSVDGGATWTTLQAAVPVGGTYSNPTEGISFTIAPGTKPFIAVQTDVGVSGGDVFLWTVVNEPPRLDPVPVIFSSPNLPRLIMHGDGFWDAPPANWTISFTSSAAYSISAVYAAGPNVGNPVPGYPVTGNLNIPGTGVNRNLTFKNDHVHFTVNRGRRGVAVGDVFRFTTYENKPSVLVHGSASGWQPEAEYGKWYWNGKIGFKLNLPVAQVFKGGDVILSSDPDYPKISVTRVRPDTPELVYTFTRVAATPVTFAVTRSDVGSIDFCPLNGTFKDKYITVSITDPSATFQIGITADQFQFWNAQDTVVVRPQIPGLLPTSNDFFAFKKAHYDRLGINLEYANVLTIPDTTALGLTAVDPAYIDISTGGVPIEVNSPEVVRFSGWMPLKLDGYDAVSSFAHFPDQAVEVKVKSAVSGEEVGRVYSDGTINEPIRFEWNSSFFTKYLPLNASSNVVLYNSFMNDNVRVLMTERINFIQSGGVLAEDAMFNDNVFVNLDEAHDWAIDLDQFEEVQALVEDGPFEGFLPGYDNLPYDAENVVNLISTLGQTLIGTYEGEFDATQTFPQTVTLPFSTVVGGTTLVTGPASLSGTSTISVTGPGRVTVTAYTAYLGGGTSTIFTENFSTALTGYTLASGSIGIFSVGSSPYGQAITVASQTSGTPSQIRKTFPVMQVEEFKFKVRVNSVNSDDGGNIFLIDATNNGLAGLIPAREAAFDSLRRPLVYWRNSTGVGYTTAFIPTAMAVGVWYEGRFYNDAGTRRFSLTNLSTNAVQTVALGSYGTPTVSAMIFTADSGGTTSSTSYADISATSPGTPLVDAGRYDTGAAIVDHFLRAVHLAGLVAPTAAELEELATLSALVNDYLQPGGVLATSLPQFLASLDADIYSATALSPQMGRPTLGAAIDVTQTFGDFDFVGATTPVAPPGGFTVGMTWLRTATTPSTMRIWDGSTWVNQVSTAAAGRRNDLIAATSFNEAISFVSIEDANLFDEEGFDMGGFDTEDESTAILLALTNPPIPTGTIPATYADLNTPLYTPTPVRRVEVSFASVPSTTPAFQVWTPAMVSPLPVPVVEQLSARRFRFSLGAESEVKVIVT